MAQVTTIQEIHRDGSPDRWYQVDANGKVISPVCTSLEQLRWALAQMCNAVNAEPVQVVNNGQ